MTVLSVANQAGSAGKTSTATTLAALLAAEGRSVQLLDFDGQANTTWWLGHVSEGDAAPTTGDVLLRRVTLDAALVDVVAPDTGRRRASTNDGGAGGEGDLRLLPANRTLDQDAVELARALGGDQRLRQAIETQTDRPDVTIIDCPGALSILTVAALVASDHVITVATPSVKEIAGVPPLEATIAEVADAYNPKLALRAIIPCIVPPASAGALYSEALTLLTDTYGDLVTPTIRRSVRIPEAYAHQTPLPIHAPHEPVTDDYRNVLAHLQATGVL